MPSRESPSIQCHYAPRQLSSDLRHCRQFSSANSTRISEPNAKQRRIWTKAELEVLNAKVGGFGLPFSRRAPLHGKPPIEHGREKDRREEEPLIWICLVSILSAWWYFDLNRFLPGTEHNASIFDAPKFTPFSIVSREEVSQTSFIITLRPRSFAENPKSANFDPYEKEWERGTWSVEFKQPELQIARSYTPLPPGEDDSPGDLRFLIRREAKGEVSRYLSRMTVGEQLELRGPHPELELPQEVSNVVFLAGGTGIAPALQVAHTLLEARKSSERLPNIRIIWANRKREDCIGGAELHKALGSEEAEGTIVQELRRLHEKYPDNVIVEYFVDEEGKFLDQKKISQVTKKEVVSKHPALSTRIDSKLLLISGPEGFVNFLAGPKKYCDGKEVQGELGGLIGRLGIRDWKVWKQ